MESVPAPVKAVTQFVIVSAYMFASAQNLSSESLQLKAEVEKFLNRVRAA